MAKRLRLALVIAAALSVPRIAIAGETNTSLPSVGPGVDGVVGTERADESERSIEASWCFSITPIQMKMKFIFIE